MFPMLSGLFIKGDNGWVVLAHKTISVPLSLLLEFLGLQNSILCGVIFVFYCTRIFKFKMASGRHLKGHLESTFMGFLVCRILVWCNFAF